MELWKLLPAASMPLDFLSYVLLTISVRRAKGKDGEASIGYFVAQLAASAATAIYGFEKGDPWVYSAVIVSAIGQLLVFMSFTVNKKFSREEKILCVALVTAVMLMKYSPNLDLAQFSIGLVVVWYYRKQLGKIRRVDDDTELPTSSLCLFAVCGALMLVYYWHGRYYGPAIGVAGFLGGKLLLLFKRLRPRT